LRERRDDIDGLARQDFSRRSQRDLGRAELSLSTARSRSCVATPGPATFASCGTFSSGPSCCATSASSIEATCGSSDPPGSRPRPRRSLDPRTDGAAAHRKSSEEGARKVEAAAKRLGIPRSSLYEKIRRLGLTLPRTSC
jgi:DNA-binding NtrC family response regulator